MSVISIDQYEHLQDFWTRFLEARRLHSGEGVERGGGELLHGMDAASVVSKRRDKVQCMQCIISCHLSEDRGWYTCIGQKGKTEIYPLCITSHFSSHGAWNPDNFKHFALSVSHMTISCLTLCVRQPLFREFPPFCLMPDYL